MENPLILVADADSKNLQILRDSLESSGFSVITANDGLLAWEKIQSEHPDLILSEVNLPNYDGFQLLEKLKEDPITSVIPVMFLTNRREIQDRVRSLRGGVKDYMIKPLHVKEVIARIRMILRRIERVKSEDSENSKKMAGRLEEYSVIELIDNFGAERKTGVLQIYNELNRNGEIWFKFGAVVHASFGTLKAEKAVYQMLPWQQGHFIMTFKDVQVPETINVSNLGLLLHGYKRMEQREQLFKQLPSPETTFVLTEAFRKAAFNKELSQEAAKFIALIDGRRDIMQIIDESVYDDIHTLERLVKLYKKGLIKQGKPSDHTATEINIAAPAETDIKEDFSDPSIQLKYEEAQKNDNDLSVQQEKESLTSPGTNDYQTDNNFPPPDYDALDEDEHDSPVHNGLNQPELPELDFGKKAEGDDKHILSEEPQTEEISNSPEETLLKNLNISKQNTEEEFSSRPPKNDFATSSPKADSSESWVDATHPVRLQNEQNEQQSSHILGEQEKSLSGTIGNDFDSSDKYQSQLDIPEPLTYNDFSPNIDIKNALSEQKTDPFVEPSHVDDSPIISPDREEISTESTRKHDEGEIAEDQTTKQTSETEPAHSEAKKLTYSFPLRSYGKPRIEKETEEKIKDSKPESPSSQLKSSAEVETPFEMKNVHSTVPTRSKHVPPPQHLPKPDEPEIPNPKPQIPKSLPKKQGFESLDTINLPQVQKANKNFQQQKPQTKRIEQRAFTDLEHLIPKQQTIQPAPPPREKPQPAQVVKPPQKIDDHVSAEITDLLVRYFEKKKISNPKIVLIGTKKKFIESFAAYLLDDKPLKESKSQIFNYFAARERKPSPAIAFTVVGVTMENQFTHLLDKISSDIAGCILLIDASDRTKLNYISYLHKTLKEKYDCNYGIAIYDGTSSRNLALDTIKDLIGANKEDLVMKLEMGNEQDHLLFLCEMLNETKKDTHNR